MEEFKEIFYFAISLIISVVVISFISILGVTTYEISTARNSEIYAAENIRYTRKYSYYDNQNITGADVIALLRENAITGHLHIYLDRNINNLSMTMTNGNFTDDIWSFESLMQSIKSDTIYTAILVYGYENPATAVYIENSIDLITGIRLFKND